MTLGLGNVGGSLYVLNLVILHFNQITLSFSGDFWFWLKAQRSLTFVYVELFNALSMMSIWPVAAYYVQDTACHLTFEPLGINWVFGMRRAVMYGALLQAFIILACWLPALMILSVSGRCEPLMVYGNLLGIIVAILVCSKFLPQLQASIYAKGSHSLSYVTYGFDAVAGVVAWAQKVFITKERVSSWLPPLFLHALEVIVLGLNFYHDTRRSKDEAGGMGGRRHPFYRLLSSTSSSRLDLLTLLSGEAWLPARLRKKERKKVFCFVVQKQGLNLDDVVWVAGSTDGMTSGTVTAAGPTAADLKILP